MFPTQGDHNSVGQVREDLRPILVTRDESPINWDRREQARERGCLTYEHDRRQPQGLPFFTLYLKT